MAGYVKELLLDYALHRLNIDLRSDLSLAIQSAFQSHIFRSEEFTWFEYYLRGYTAKEIADLQNATHTILPVTTTVIEQTLERIFTAIEVHSGYSDALLIHKVDRDKQYRRSGVRELETFLLAHGKEYMSHEVRGAK